MFKKTTTWIKENKEFALSITLLTIGSGALIYAGYQLKNSSNSLASDAEGLRYIIASAQSVEDLVTGKRETYPVLDGDRMFELTYFGPASEYKA